MHVDVGGTTAGIPREVRRLRDERQVPPIAADRRLVAGAVRIATRVAAGDAPRGVRLRVTKVDVSDAILVRWLGETNRRLPARQVCLRHERDESAIGADGGGRARAGG